MNMCHLEEVGYEFGGVGLVWRRRPFSFFYLWPTSKRRKRVGDARLVWGVMIDSDERTRRNTPGRTARNTSP